mmetsp:Transcript_16216/g.40686  ORF Transcript_16216/g.40686 Transcript_16216/m.40686 type:complete len:88 (+) Transcript_16216:1464-1727(+)
MNVDARTYWIIPYLRGVNEFRSVEVVTQEYHVVDGAHKDKARKNYQESSFRGNIEKVSPVVVVVVSSATIHFTTRPDTGSIGGYNII